MANFMSGVLVYCRNRNVELDNTKLPANEQVLPRRAYDLRLFEITILSFAETFSNIPRHFHLAISYYLANNMSLFIPSDKVAIINDMML